ncbi:hypothetical protein FB45DRAFT_863242 [Roridomyces roridus]|uniref:Uncharacterized protein n=1 Tax=Roridomyces roridus TaxID=1738132 RepID=A0AAD7C951_9AGAR|nr:hypothetical protein FB45DRAFT_863242 [Roridomyces roridus]
MYARQIGHKGGTPRDQIGGSCEGCVFPGENSKRRLQVEERRGFGAMGMWPRGGEPGLGGIDSLAHCFADYAPRLCKLEFKPHRSWLRLHVKAHLAIKRGEDDEPSIAVSCVRRRYFGASMRAGGLSESAPSLVTMHSTLIRSIRRHGLRLLRRVSAVESNGLGTPLRENAPQLAVSDDPTKTHCIPRAVVAQFCGCTRPPTCKAGSSKAMLVVTSSPGPTSPTLMAGIPSDTPNLNSKNIFWQRDEDAEDQLAPTQIMN